MKRPGRGRITLRTAGASDAKKLHALIRANLEEGHLLPRTLGPCADDICLNRLRARLRGDDLRIRLVDAGERIPVRAAAS